MMATLSGERSSRVVCVDELGGGKGLVSLRLHVRGFEMTLPGPVSVV